MDLATLMYRVIHMHAEREEEEEGEGEGQSRLAYAYCWDSSINRKSWQQVEQPQLSLALLPCRSGSAVTQSGLAER